MARKPDRCDLEIFQHGEPVALLDARAVHAEKWVRAVAKAAKARVDWHYSGGVAQVLHLGDQASRARVEKTIDRLAHALNGTMVRRVRPVEPGLYRRGVSEAPPGTIAAFYEGGEARSTFIVRRDQGNEPR